MRIKRTVAEAELAALAKRFRVASGRSKVEVARELKVAPPTVFSAEERPDLSLTKLRMRMIERYSPYRVAGPVFVLTRK